MIWQVQEAKQRFSELLRRAHDEGPQWVTNLGVETGVILSPEEYRRLTAKKPDFKEFLLSGPKFEDADAIFIQPRDYPRDVEL
jgi:prevent-host-death family protein